MSAGAIIEKYQGAQGWTDLTVLDLLITYVDNQGSDDALEDYLAQACDDEAYLDRAGEEEE